MSLLAVLDESEQFLTPIQIRMLDALLGEGAVGDEAVRDWAAGVDIDALDTASYRLVPALCARAGSNPALRPLHGRMKGIYRYYFYRNNRFLTYVERVFSALMAAESISSCSKELQPCCNTIAALRFGRSAIAIFSFNGATKSAPKRC